MKNIDDTFTNYVTGFFSRDYYLNDDKILPLDSIEAETHELFNCICKIHVF
jgi:hypothetical protein